MKNEKERMKKDRKKTAMIDTMLQHTYSALFLRLLSRYPDAEYVAQSGGSSPMADVSTRWTADSDWLTLGSKTSVNI